MDVVNCRCLCFLELYTKVQFNAHNIDDGKSVEWGVL